MAEWRDLSWPHEDCSRVPYPVFNEAEIFDLEQERIFRGPIWCYAALEAEIPNPGDYKTTFIGDTPIVVVRGQDGALCAFVNRCAHRGTLLVRDLTGNTDDFTCIYHHWCYDQKGNLIGVPFLRGLKGKGGMPEDFNLADHGLHTLLIDTYAGVIFVSFDETVEPLIEFMDAPMREFLDRVLEKPIEIIGYTRQRIPGNWKLYFENLHDVYHAGLLHQQSTVFGQFRATQDGGITFDKDRRHKITHAFHESDVLDDSKDGYQHTDWIDGSHKLNDPSIFEFRDELGDNKAAHFLTFFPSSVVQQLCNSLATRQIRPRGPNEFELYWTYFGYTDDTAEMRHLRMKQANNVGPAGITSMEDGEAGRLVQLGIRGASDEHSVIEMGGRGAVENQDTVLTEVAVRGFWLHYCKLMGVTPGHAVAAE